MGTGRGRALQRIPRCSTSGVHRPVCWIGLTRQRALALRTNAMHKHRAGDQAMPSSRNRPQTSAPAASGRSVDDVCFATNAMSRTSLGPDDRLARGAGGGLEASTSVCGAPASAGGSRTEAVRTSCPTSGRPESESQIGQGAPSTTASVGSRARQSKWLGARCVRVRGRGEYDRFTSTSLTREDRDHHA